MKVFVPRDYQRALRDFALDNARCQWWAGTGVGKTATWLTVIDMLRMYGEVRHVLVVSTKTVATLVWPEEIRKWLNFEHLTMAVAVGTPEARVKALRRRADITLINYDMLPWLVEVMGDEWYFDMVIPDESTRLKGLRIDTRVGKKSGDPFDRRSGGGMRAYALGKVAHRKVRHWINGTGTPAPNGLIDLWGQAWFIDGGKRLHRNFTAFKEAWFNAVRVDTYQTILRPTPFADAEIKERLVDITLTIEAKDYMELPALLINQIKVPLPPDARKHYDEMEQSFFTAIRGHDILAVNQGAKGMKLRQLASGMVYDADHTHVIAHEAKLDRCQDIVEELNGASVVITYQFVSDVQMLQKRFPQARVFDRASWAAFKAGELQLLLVHPDSAGHGVDGLQEYCHHMIVFSQTWDLEKHTQVIERIGPTRQASSGHMRDVHVHLLIGENTVEEEMVERLETKASVEESLKLAMKRRAKQ